MPRTYLLPMDESTPPRPLLQPLREQLAAEYDVEREIGRGGMAVVFKATERQLGRAVALKVLPPELAGASDVAERFRREARMTAALDHPNVMPIYRVGQSNGGLTYIAMKYVEGRSLEAIVEEQGALPVPVVLVVLRGAAAGLAQAHEHGIIHRDIKGGNVLVDADGRILVTDFGIARALEDPRLTSGGTVVGTPHFMSPEQCTGKPLGPQADQYSLGVLAFQMLTGTVPFDGESLAGIMQHHFFTPIPELRSRRSDIPSALIAVVRRATAKKPEQRYATTRHMLEAIEAVPLTDSDRRKAEGDLRTLALGGSLERIAVTGPPTDADPGPSRFRGRSAAITELRLLAQIAKRPFRSRRGKLIASAVAGVVAVVLAVGLRLSTQSPDALRRAVAYYEAGDRDAARREFRVASSANPAAPLPHLYLGRIARERHEWAEARRELQAALELDPRSATARREMGSLFLASGNDDGARAAYAAALSLDPSDRISAGYLACALVRLGRRDESTRFLARAGAGPWSSCAGGR
ncbi:MAG: hypothetical protein NVS1B4_21680 [Gemmatimonadaceae bacterium]